MKLITKFSLASLVVLACSTSAYAANQKYFDKLDANGDQTLNKAEFTAGLQKYFVKKDITDPEEQKKKATNGFSKRDANGDGKLTFEEFSKKR